ncbi:adenosylcobinamide-phosphate synthase CbiB [Xenorhabdus bovienii]|uniref:adenosylcobinamide-phosphate synthase CbiB n=1 Tax=Xenorhabdus bovienii TaxID=40576 RepID=UPI00237CC5E2|nr:adenosylcobinamide-phosphate synthase CbiB [Xenorhabdus bovienii]MDE1486322.1 adenosylcobinamide-phosphate synthase CbiB [Xenorhabdus bovienii]MDE1491375.1 adenosylcobinamide-phosphate synthase CbiB [Xenorhabdus bovienii]MDE1496009.1 adenosylcobinamide-phosphate synthase CbiB [Xenorhabdus bovienii]MDE9474007.1 adenosylcobinamide-phosphate synthase CbiB [Xenorhabdus bovienii]MDE9477124.1 adenosylcobinamide-phosphate synthase CbiB [Xenorhabdus bovienii]
MTVLLWFAAFVLDMKLGDPPHWPHPVRWMGRLINQAEHVIRGRCKTEADLKWGGVALWLVVVGSVWLMSYLVLWLAYGVAFWFGMLVEVWLIYTVLSGRSLGDAANAVYQPLKQGDLAASRQQLAQIVGRETSQLQPPQISRAAIETVAENSVDGVIAPLFFLMIGGAPLAMAYKAVNTLDSMVGYKTPRYRALGMFSARMDDVANGIPARLGWLLLALAAKWQGLDFRQALRIGWRDRYQHRSPNSGWPEATVAGALGIRLGGPSVYFNQRVEKPWIGDARREVTPEDIPQSVQMMRVASVMALLLFALLHSLVSVTLFNAVL